MTRTRTGSMDIMQVSSSGILLQANSVQRLEEGRELVVGDYLTDLGDNKGGYAKVSMCWAINAQTAHPKEATMLVNYLANNEEAKTDLSI